MASTAERSFHVSLSNQNSPLVQVLEGVFSRLGHAKRVDQLSEARLVFTDSSDGSLAALKEGCCVIQLSTSKRSAGEEGSALKSYFPERLRIVSRLSSPLVDCLTCINELEPQMSIDDAVDIASISSNEDISGLKILVVDDSRINRDVAKAQLAEHNSLTLVSSYRTALQVINKAAGYDIVLSDLLMPTEGFTLGRVRDRVVGAPFPAGMYVVLAALQNKVPYVALVTTGNHHDDAHIAALDLISTSTSTSDSKLVVEKQPNLIQGGKDWAAVVSQLI